MTKEEDEQVYNLLVTIGCFIILSRIALFGLAVWALIWGIADTSDSGMNTWGLVWIIAGALGILSSIGAFRRRRS